MSYTTDIEKCDYITFWINFCNYSVSVSIKNREILNKLVMEKNKLTNRGYNNLFHFIIDMKKNDKNLIFNYSNDERFYKLPKEKMAILYYIMDDEENFINCSKNIDIFNDIKFTSYINSKLIISYHKNSSLENKYNNLNILSSLISYNDENINEYIIKNMKMNSIIFYNTFIPTIIFRKNDGLYNYHKELILNSDDKKLLSMIQSAIYNNFLPLLRDVVEKNKKKGHIRYIKKNMNDKIKTIFE
jgi:hypothetical protein